MKDIKNGIGVNLRTLQNWEQQRTHPAGPARALLKTVASNLKVIGQVSAFVEHFFDIDVAKPRLSFGPSKNLEWGSLERGKPLGKKETARFKICWAFNERWNSAGD